jgi:predicted small lipoprotein YifL
MRTFLALIALAVPLAACGYKGPLYLPPERPVAQEPAPKPVPENENKKPSSQ